MRFPWTKTFREWHLDLLLMVGPLALLVLRFPGILSASPLPNWDAVGHFAALQRMTHYLASGHLTGYLPCKFCKPVPDLTFAASGVANGPAYCRCRGTYMVKKP